MFRLKVIFIYLNVKILELTLQTPKLHHIDPTQLICIAHQLTGFYMMETLAFKDNHNE